MIIKLDLLLTFRFYLRIHRAKQQQPTSNFDKKEEEATIAKWSNLRTRSIASVLSKILQNDVMCCQFTNVSFHFRFSCNLESIPTDDLLPSPDEEIAEGIMEMSPGAIAGFAGMLNGQPEYDQCGVQVFQPQHQHDTQQYEHVPVPAHFYQLPITENMESPWDFKIELNAESAGKTSWMYSTKLNKVFVKINTALNVHASYKIAEPNQVIFVRAMIVYTSNNDLAEPVMKCPNHKAQSNVADPQHILRCTVPTTQYVGVENGKLFYEKLAVIIPMNEIAHNEPLKLVFTCQNSCSGGMNRKMTSIIFTLENSDGRILGRQLMNFKVCSCPKRDREKDEESNTKALPKKRKAEPAAPSTSKKIAMTIVKQESDTTLSMNSEPIVTFMPSDSTVEVKREPTNSEVHIVMPNQDLKQKLLKNAFDMVSGEIQRTGDSATYQPYLIDIQKQIGK